MKYFAVLSLYLASLSLTAQATENNQYQTLLANAQHLYQQQDYAQALNKFEQSYQLEPLDSTLYNIAICHYKLEQWQQALNSLEMLKETQPDSELIDYNIAINQKKLGNEKSALDTFLYLSEYGEDEDIALLADQQLASFQNKINTAKLSLKSQSSLWQNTLNIQLGNESNIVLPDGENFTEKSDQFINYLFTSSWLSSPSLANAWLADFTYYGSQYSQASKYEVSMFSFSGRKFFTPEDMKNTRFYLGLSYEDLELAGNDYLNTISYSAGFRHKLPNQNQLLFDVKFRDIADGEDYFDYLAGDSTRFKLTFKNKTENGYWKLGGKYQIDDRNDRYDEDEFVSYSADRYSVFLNRYWQFNQWEFELEGEYRFSEYHDNNTFEGEADDLREDDRISLLASAVYNINDDLSVNAEFDYNDNQSSLSENDYDQTTLSVGVTWLF